ncbi:MAG: hypothetical protein QXJ07_04920 [Candidatus Bathyarchaeia archaeon]
MAEPAEDVEKKVRKKKFEEAFPESSKLLEEDESTMSPPPLTEAKINKIIGPLKRSRPELYQQLELLERETGRKKTLIVSEALHHYLIERKIIQSNIDLATLYEAWSFLADLQEHAIRNFLMLGRLVFSEEYQGMLELSRAMQAPIPPPRRLPPKARDISEKLIEKVWKFADPLIDWCMEQMMSNFAKAMNIKKPIQWKGERIPVEIIEEE